MSVDPTGSADRGSPTPESVGTSAASRLLHADFSDLEMPDIPLRGLMGHFDPGVILIMTGIGTSHLVTAPTAGGRFAYALLWCIPAA